MKFKKTPFTSGYTPPFHNEKKVYCITNGKTYNSVSEAERELGIPQGVVNKQINEKVKTARGYTFKMIDGKSK